MDAVLIITIATMLIAAVTGGVQYKHDIEKLEKHSR